jgi:hypothetical protein
MVPFHRSHKKAELVGKKVLLSVPPGEPFTAGSGQSEFSTLLNQNITSDFIFPVVTLFYQ